MVVGSIIEIQERKLGEEKILLQNELLAKANKELDYFVYSVSHDLRAPLSSILGLTNIYSLALSEKEKQDIIGMINGRAHVLDEFIREVLDYSKNTRLELRLQELVIRETVQEVVDGLTHMEGFKSVRTQVDIDPTLILSSDSERLKVVLNNLIANSIYYRDEGKDSFVRISAMKINDQCKLIIEDNGIGIKSEHHGKIFGMFYKAHARPQGTGLGLYIVKETMQRLGGSVSLSSEFGKGSVFTLILPQIPA